VLSVYLVHWNAPEWVRSAVQSIRTSDTPTRVVVISNSGHIDVPGAEVVTTEANLGYAGGANVGLRQWLATSEPFCVVGSHDAHVEPHTLRHLVSAAERNPDAGLVGPRFTEAAVNTQALATNGDIEERAWLSGTLLLLRRECIEAVGMFDEDLHSYGEDVELAYRARDASWRVIAATEATARGIGTASPGSRKMMYENDLLIRAKRRGWNGVLRGVAAILLLAIRDTSRAIVRPGTEGRSVHWDRARSKILALPGGLTKALHALR
jgi:N-acetylglucosaminyl-diphospho-decaprenol L-rhamnosyltransferase